MKNCSIRKQGPIFAGPSIPLSDADSAGIRQWFHNDPTDRSFESDFFDAASIAIKDSNGQVQLLARSKDGKWIMEKTSGPDIARQPGGWICVDSLVYVHDYKHNQKNTRRILWKNGCLAKMLAAACPGKPHYRGEGQ